MSRFRNLAAVALLFAISACTLHHSKQALWHTGEQTPTEAATFVSEEDSGLAIFGVLLVSEPDHYSILLERARRRYKCQRLSHVQLDFYTDYWIIVGFPIARVTAVCEPPGQ